MHLLSFVTWVINANKDREYTIHFVARDGYLPKLAFDLLNDTGNLKTNYLRVSRKAILTADMKCLAEGVHKWYNNSTICEKFVDKM